MIKSVADSSFTADLISPVFPILWIAEDALAMENLAKLLFVKRDSPRDRKMRKKKIRSLKLFRRIFKWSTE